MGDAAAADREKLLKATIEAWAHNRRHYPGWLIAPEHIRRVLQGSLQEWHGALLSSPAISSLDRLKALNELAWRTERALFMFPSDHEDLAHAALGTIDRVARMIDGQPVPTTEDWPELLKGADKLSLSLARNARHAGDRERFDQSLAFVRAQQDHDSELRNAVAYEECLWSLMSGDLAGLLAGLDAWIPAYGETLWSLRKAGLLAEMQDHARACALLETTLTQIRRARRRDIDDLASLSLESWALFLALAYSHRTFSRTPTLPTDMPEPFERWRALGIVDCNAFKEFQTIKRPLEARIAKGANVTKRRGFDLDHVGMTHHLGGQPSPTLVAGYEMVMLAEITGLPALVNHMNVFDDGLKLAAKTLADDKPWLAATLTIRAHPDDKLLDDVFSRVWIARLPEPTVEALRDSLLKRLEFGLSPIESSENFGRDARGLIGTSIEILSRVAVRLRPDQLRALFDDAITHYRSATFRRRSIDLGIPLAHLMARILESLPRADILALLPQLFQLPLPGVVGKSQHESRWHDPVGLLPEWLDEPFKDSLVRAPIWDALIPTLFTAAKGADTIDRAAAIGRLFKLLRWGILNDAEKLTFADAVWAAGHLDPLGVPTHTSLRNWVLLEMPEVHPGLARDVLLKFIGGRARSTEGNLRTHLGEIGELLRHLVRLKVSFELTDDVRAELIKMVTAWAQRLPEGQSPFDRLERHDSERDAAEGVALILRYVGGSDEVYDKVWARISGPRVVGVAPAFVLYPALASHWPDKSSELIDEMRRSLVSDQEDDVRAAVQGLFEWISALNESSASVDERLDDLVREVGFSIAARRAAILRSALGFAQWLFRWGPERLRTLIANDCDYGLAALVEEASYTRSGQAYDVPAIRAACVRLASAMAAAGVDQGRGVRDWQATTKSDPLPEVRNAEIRIRDEQSDRQSE
ncbi:hypothetical protein V1284_005513 [Nitrobacteraceae bacterium AZCC 2299]